MKDFDVFSWYGLSAATGTPGPIVECLGAEVVAALADPVVAARIRQMGAEPAPLGPDAYASFISAELDKWAPIVKASGAAVD